MRCEEQKNVKEIACRLNYRLYLGSIAAALDFCSGAEIDDAQVPYTAAASSLPQTNTTMTPRSARSARQNKAIR